MLPTGKQWVPPDVQAKHVWREFAKKIVDKSVASDREVWCAAYGFFLGRGFRPDQAHDMAIDVMQEV